MKHDNGPDHYIDLEDLAACGLTPETLPPLRYDFLAALVRVRVAHPENFPAIDPARDSDHTRELDAFLPWAITENYEKLKSGFATLKAFQQFGGTPSEVANAQADIVYVMGVMGYYVGDGSQPPHTTRHFNGWVVPILRATRPGQRFTVGLTAVTFAKPAGSWPSRCGTEFIRRNAWPARTSRASLN